MREFKSMAEKRRFNRITAVEKSELKKVLSNTWDFCGSLQTAASDFCHENGLDFNDEIQQIIIKVINSKGMDYFKNKDTTK